MMLFLTLLSGIAWTLAYADSIRVGFRDRTYALPVAALALNFAWEVIYAVHGLSEPFEAQTVVNIVWALADTVIVYTFVRFGRSEFSQFVSRAMFVGWGVLIFVASFVVQWLFVVQFDWVIAPRYAAFLQNLLMSGLFVAIFVARRGLRGQSLLIAVAKWFGTLAPTILFGVIEDSPFILGIGLLCSVFDLVYIGLVLRETMRSLRLVTGANPR